MKHSDFKKLGGAECLFACDLGFDFTMAFQPIVNTQTKTIFAQEALVRGLNQEGAFQFFQNVNESYRFDQSCRVKAIKLAAELESHKQYFLSINFLPNAVYKPELCIRTTLSAAKEYGFPKEKMIFECTEDKKSPITIILSPLSNTIKNKVFSPRPMTLAQGLMASISWTTHKLTLPKLIWH